MPKPTSKLFLGVALLSAALLLFAPLRTAAQTAKSSDSDRWIHEASLGRNERERRVPFR